MWGRGGKGKISLHNCKHGTPLRAFLPSPHPALVSAPADPSELHPPLTPSPLPTNAQTARKIHVAKFRAQKVNLLITTDVAARGIDIPLIDNVINLDFPPKVGLPRPTHQ